MTIDKIRELDQTALAQQIKEGEDQLFRLRFQIGMGQMDGIKRYRELRRDRARLLGVTRERELAAGKNLAAPVVVAKAVPAKNKGKK